MSVDAIFDFDLNAVDEDPNAFPDGTHKASVYKAEVVKYKDASKGKAIVFTYRLQEGDHKGKDIQEWQSANSFDTSTKKSYLKRRLLSLGIPESRLNTLTMEDLSDLIGTMVFITKKQNGQYHNITNVRLDDGSAAAEAQTAVSADLL